MTNEAKKHQLGINLTAIIIVCVRGCLWLFWPCGKRWVIDKAEQLLGVTNGHQPLHCELKSQWLVLWWLVHWNKTDMYTIFNSSFQKIKFTSTWSESLIYSWNQYKDNNNDSCAHNHLRLMSSESLDIWSFERQKSKKCCKECKDKCIYQL